MLRHFGTGVKIRGRVGELSESERAQDESFRFPISYYHVELASFSAADIDSIIDCLCVLES